MVPTKINARPLFCVHLDGRVGINANVYGRLCACACGMRQIR